MKKAILSTFLVSTLLFSLQSKAGGWVNTDTADMVAFQTGGFFLYADGWGNPNNCTKSHAVVLRDTDPNYDKAYALLLSAYTAKKKIKGYSDGCASFDGQTYNTIRGFKYLTVSD